MNHLRSVIWFLIGMFVGSCNDVWVRLLPNIPALEISFFRFLFSTLTVIPFIIKNPGLLKTNNIRVHCFRGIIFFLAITLWELGVKDTMLSIATLIGFSTPFFLLILSILVLGEKINSHRMLATTVSFLTVIGIVDLKTLSFGSSFLILLVSSFFFAITDVLNKKYSSTENHLTSLIYYNFFAFLISVPFVLKIFVYPSLIDIFYMFCLGLEANVYSYSLLKAFSLSDATFLSPFKYFEFIFSMFLGYVCFSEVPVSYCFVVMIVIILSNSFLLFKESKIAKN